MAFKSPDPPGKCHPVPWKATTRHNGFDVHRELGIAAGYKPPGHLKPFEVARTITSVLRLLVDPTIRFLCNRRTRPRTKQNGAQLYAGWRAVRRLFPAEAQALPPLRVA